MNILLLRFRKNLSMPSAKEVIGVLLALCLLEPLPVWAGYQPPSDPSAPSSGTSTAGTRGGCSGKVDGGLTALAPLSHTGQTTSTHPTFLWFVADTQAYPLEFRLYQQTSGRRQLLHKVKMQSQPGLMQVSLPTNQPALVPGKLYSWQVILSCNPNHPSGDSVAGATLQVVSMPSSVRSQLSSTKSASDRATVYSQNGLWYDAIAQVSQPNSTVPAKQLQSLLTDLAQSEKETPQFAAIVREQKARLKQIAALQQRGG